MSTHKNIDRICIVAIVLALLVAVASMNGEALGIKAADRVMGYESRLFDTSSVHTLSIVMDDWDEFIDSCTSEEYYACAVVIDNESYKNVAIRGKGNTSLSNVASLNSERYSFKIEFDHYDSNKSYHGLDKLSLNNIIQDNTYMKDYLSYQMMAAFGVDAPLCSFVYITVNGEDWGLYLAVEGVEDAFLQRNYGSDAGELYKPDSMSFGGGRGNGKDFNIDDFDFGDTTVDLSNIGLTDEDLEILGLTDADLTAVSLADLDMSKLSQIDVSHLDLSGLDFAGFGGMGSFGGRKQSDDTAKQSDASENNAAGASDNNGTADGSAGASDNTMPQRSEMPTDGSFPTRPDDNTDNSTDGSAVPDMPDGATIDFDNMDFGDMDFGNIGGGMSMGSDDVKLAYIDDDPDSYSNIFDNAKTDVSDKDAERLIASLKTLSAYENLDSVLDTDEVLRYFVVHNFVVNGDSYTGSMIHNYYLYEKDGQLSMIPWDYNLAYGTFQGGNASSSVNDAIDDVLDDRPMQAWIFSDEQYTEQYHALYAEFLETVDANAIIDEAYALIAPYVEKDPTKFCTYEEFEAGVTALKTFCTLRAESVSGQLDGSIPSTSDGQSADSSTLVDTGSLNLSDMGTMSSGGGGNMGMMPDKSDAESMPQMPDFTPGSFGDTSGDTTASDSTTAATSATASTAASALTRTSAVMKTAASSNVTLLQLAETDSSDNNAAVQAPTMPSDDSGMMGGQTPPDGSGMASGQTPPDGSGMASGQTPPDGSGMASGQTPPDGSGMASGQMPPDGSTIADGETTTAPDGTTNGTATAPDGTTDGTVTAPDGTTDGTTTAPDGTTDGTATAPDGTTDGTTTVPDGTTDGTTAAEAESNAETGTDVQSSGKMQAPDGMQGDQSHTAPDSTGGGMNGETFDPTSGFSESTSTDMSAWILLGVSVLVMSAGLFFAFKFKR